jgi:hypothetical protein
VQLRWFVGAGCGAGVFARLFEGGMMRLLGLVLVLCVGGSA